LCFGVDSRVIIYLMQMQRTQKKGNLFRIYETFHFQPAEERFHDTIIIAVTLSGHRLNNTCVIAESALTGQSSQTEGEDTDKP